MAKPSKAERELHAHMRRIKLRQDIQKIMTRSRNICASIAQDKTLRRVQKRLGQSCLSAYAALNELDSLRR